MSPTQASSLKKLSIPVAGTQFENRSKIIRTLEIGTKVHLVLVQDNQHDKEAIAIKLGDQQLGWIPREMATAIRGLNKRVALVTGIGTDQRGSWTQLTIEITYDESISAAARVISSIGPVAASVLHKMHVKDPEEAVRIAQLPKDEQSLAIEEWNMTHVNSRISSSRRKK